MNWKKERYTNKIHDIARKFSVRVNGETIEGDVVSFNVSNGLDQPAKAHIKFSNGAEMNVHGFTAKTLINEIVNEMERQQKNGITPYL